MSGDVRRRVIVVSMDACAKRYGEVSVVMKRKTVNVRYEKNVWNSSRIPLQTNNKPKWMDPFLYSRDCVCVGVQVWL